MVGEVDVIGAIAFSRVVISEMCDYLQDASTTVLLRRPEPFYKYLHATLIRTAVAWALIRWGSRTDALKVW
ncbi:MAG: hypothetical protein ACRENH_18580 [Gemmatimonadaceae bacterium]